MSQRNRLMVFALVIFIGNGTNLQGQSVTSEKLPTYNQALDSMEVRFLRIQDYQVTIDVVMDVKGIHIPPMMATIFFKQPDKIHVKSRGFAIFPRNAVMASPAQFRKLASDGSVLGIEEIDQKKMYHLRLIPEVEDKNISVQVDLWLDHSLWIIKKMRVESNKFGWMEIINEFQLIDQIFWLPKQSRVRMEVDREAMTRFRTQVPMNPESQFKRPSILNDLFGTGQMYISFRNYKINSGLSDDIFDVDKK